MVTVIGDGDDESFLDNWLLQRFKGLESKKFVTFDKITLIEFILTTRVTFVFP